MSNAGGTDWLELDPNDDRCYSHVWLYMGHDLTAAGIFQPSIEPCLMCPPGVVALRTLSGAAPALILDDTAREGQATVHFVTCGDCGTRGPWASTESAAVEAWNAASRRLNRSAR